MKFRQFSIALSLAAAVICARAQESTGAIEEGASQIERANLQEKGAAGREITAEKAGKPEKPERPAQAAKNEAKDVIQSLRDGFKAKAEEYQKQHKEILGQMKSASAEERAKLRQDLKELKERFKELSQELREEKLAELREKTDREAIKEGPAGGRPRD